ncbi:CapA family protein [Aliifodinibius sp. S!AR15-10]|uniref:CapA family protein n=1 Tax=Aliifodinibius sp. S!AR15-10 TaxID=2950437 RepID=UPI0028626F9D|nr:CapA family protein [Aliifodinibius sp. S!AR15-10]MDR8390248.1 CapA family protein [Aliifodinibius sp. S!AR15-10]
MGDEIKILITGDTHLGGGRVKQLALDNNVDQLFGDFLPLIRNADLSITNLESPCVDNGRPILKTGPNLKSPAASLNVLKSAGFDLVTLANNHIMDYGLEGLSSTIKGCSKYSIKSVGAGTDIEKASHTFYYVNRGIRVAIINIAENEFGTTNGDKPGAHPLNTIQNYYTIQQANNKADRVIVIIHGGHEYYPLPSPRMRETYRYFIDIGADIVVGHHPHCYSGFEVYKKAPIFYSLGNFLFDKNGSEKDMGWNTGFMLELTINKSQISFEIHPYIQNYHEAGLNKLGETDKAEFEQNISRLSEIIIDKAKLEDRFDVFCKKSQKIYSSYVEPHSNKWIHALRNRNYLPSFLSKKKKILLLNLTRCEAHRDVLIKLLDYENSNSSEE